MTVRKAKTFFRSCGRSGNPRKVSAFFKSLKDVFLFLGGEAVPVLEAVADSVPILRRQGLPLPVALLIALLILGRELPVPVHSSAHLVLLIRGQGLPLLGLVPQTVFVLRGQS